MLDTIPMIIIESEGPEPTNWRAVGAGWARWLLTVGHLMFINMLFWQNLNNGYSKAIAVTVLQAPGFYAIQRSVHSMIKDL